MKSLTDALYLWYYGGMRELDTYEDLEELDDIFGDLNLTMLHSGEKHRVFVYGTLMTGMRNHSRLEGDNARLIDKSAQHLGTVSMHSRETNGGYLAPIVVQELAEQPLAVIDGEVYEVSDQVLNTLDIFEGHPEVYERQKAFVYSVNGLEEMWMYYYVAGTPPNRAQEGVTIAEDETHGFNHYKWRGL